MLWCGLTQDDTHRSGGLLHVLFISSLPQHAALPLSLPLSPPLSVTHCGFLEYMFGLLNSWCSASQLLLALTQTATNWSLLLSS
ncbi:unnamed protein product [Hymenolepis diminuta]|uniref:Uncharacterized protein n=1 Tax=Hymenolepis diminuta TaxID=6216 RepID=A0A564Y5J2_HYMDI|nr:unnamed protein product [Hymenolepis diminuta]